MRYLLLICTDASADPDEPETVDIETWVAETDASGARVFGDRLRPAQDAVTVKRRGGTVHASDGPFAETKEMIGGLDIIECASREEAIEIAGRHPMAGAGQIEIREFWAM